MSPIGEWLRKYRIETRITLREMSRRIGVSAAYLSAVENGHKSPTERLLNDIVNIFGFEEEKAHELRVAADQSKNSVQFRIEKTQPRGDAEVAALFARNFGKLDENQKEKIRKLLGG